METAISNIGYSPLSAVNRTIKDGSRFDALFPKPDGKKTLLKKDGDVEETVQFMKQIVHDNNHQTKKLAAKLAVRRADGSLDEYRSVQNLWNFVVTYIKYNIESGEQLRTPAKTWYDAQVMARQNPAANNPLYSADCDCMSIFCGCVLLNWGIPFSFRITGYADVLGICRGFQHVYTIAHGKAGDIICDPVYHKFNEEKRYEMQETIPISLNGCDIYALSGLPEDDLGVTEYIEQPDGGLGLLSGRKARKAKRKARKKARKEARKEKRAAKKAIKKAKKSGDKEALKKAKADKKAAKKKLQANRGGVAKAVRKVGKAVATFTKKSTMLVPRSMFLLLLRLNFRGMARKFANNQKAYDKFAKTWKKVFGGKEKKLTLAIEKGKGRKALFGSKKTVGDLAAHLNELGSVLGEYGIFSRMKEKFLRLFKRDAKLNGSTLGELGFTTAAIGTAIASAMPIVKKVMSVMKEVGEHLPETADEAWQEGMEVEEVSENYNAQVEDEDTDDEEDDDDEDEGEEDESEETMEGFTLKGYEDGAYFIADAVGELGSLENCFYDIDGLGKVKKVKKNKSAKKAAKKQKKAAKKAAKQQKKATKKAAKKTASKTAKKTAKQEKKAAKKAAKQEKKAAKKAAKQEKKAEKKAAKSVQFTPSPAPAPSTTYDEAYDEATEVQDVPGTQKGGKIVSFVTNVKDKIANNPYASAITNAAVDKLQQKLAPQQDDENNENFYTMDNTTTSTTSTTSTGEGFFAKHKGKVLVGVGLIIVGVVTYAAFSGGNTAPKTGVGSLKAIDLS